MRGGWIFWLFQHWMPLGFSLLPPGLLYYSALSPLNAADQLASGSLILIGVFLLFAVALDIPNNLVADAKKANDLSTILLGTGAVFLVVAAVEFCVYFYEIQRPFMFQTITEPDAIRGSRYFCLFSVIVYAFGCLITMICRGKVKRYT